MFRRTQSHRPATEVTKTCFKDYTPQSISKWRRTAILIQGHIEGCERMLESNEKLFRVLKGKYHVSNKQVQLLMETMAFIEKEVVNDIDELDRLANTVIVLMDGKDGHEVIELIPTIKDIKEECNALMCRLADHKKGIASYERNVKRSRRVV